MGVLIIPVAWFIGSLLMLCSPRVWPVGLVGMGLEVLFFYLLLFNGGPGSF